jgi:epoxyqueuosine reductase
LTKTTDNIDKNALGREWKTYSADYIKREALRLGFTACGIAKAEHVSEAEERRFKTWLERGFNADMRCMENYLEKRMDPRLLLDGAKSIVSVALNYTPKKAMPKSQPQIAAYALGKDYHDVVKFMLFQLASSLQCEEGNFKVCVDTSPILERYWAVKAGLGWQSKSKQLIIPKAGTMFFLGELLLCRDVDHYDQPMESRCGNCQQCIDACPTRVLSPDGSFDARRCLSYQTIENRGELSEATAKAMGNVIYGCDRCQLCCPVNRWAKPTNNSELQPSEQLLQMTAEQWEELTQEEYRTLFKGSAVKRVKYSGLMRNINAALHENKQNDAGEDNVN